VASYLDSAKRTEAHPKALIVPHAGYVYSGPVAAAAYRLLNAARDVITRVVLLGPSHHAAFDGLALCSWTQFNTPLGSVALDAEAVERIVALPHVRIDDAAHLREHCLEVQLPFLQAVLDKFKIVPLLVGDATPEQVAQPIECLWGGEETLIIVSSDLSHYHDYATAVARDHKTTRLIETLRLEELNDHDACGCRAIRGLLLVARRRGLRVLTIDLQNSGDTAGPRSTVVGYGAYAFEETSAVATATGEPS
jgi:AmmeMemoRadiSam system protein B